MLCYKLYLLEMQNFESVKKKKKRKKINKKKTCEV